MGWSFVGVHFIGLIVQRSALTVATNLRLDIIKEAKIFQSSQTTFFRVKLNSQHFICLISGGYNILVIDFNYISYIFRTGFHRTIRVCEI